MKRKAKIRVGMAVVGLLALAGAVWMLRGGGLGTNEPVSSLLAKKPEAAKVAGLSRDASPAQARSAAGGHSAQRPDRSDSTDRTDPRDGTSATAPAFAATPAAPRAAPATMRDDANAELGKAQDRYADCVVLDEKIGPTDAQGRYERVRVVKTDMKYPLVRVVEKRVKGSAFAPSGATADKSEFRVQSLAERRHEVASHQVKDKPVQDTLLSQIAMVADHVTVRVKDGTTEAELAAYAKANGGKILRKLRVPGPGTYLVKLASVTVNTVPQAIIALGRAGGPVAGVESDRVVYATGTVPNDPRFAELWGMQNDVNSALGALGPATVWAADPANPNVDYDAYRFVYSPGTPPNGINGTLYFCSLGKPGEFPGGVSGFIALIERGDISYAEKAANAKAAGAAAAVIYNNEDGNLGSTLGGPGDWIPTVGIPRSVGTLLRGLGNVTAVVTAPSGTGDIDAPLAWDLSTGSRNVLVGVIDTGIDDTHEDLAANMWRNPGETGLDVQGNDKRTNGIDDDDNGYVDDWRGWDFFNEDNDPKDDHFHGTHCAGTIGGVGNNGIGVAGVCWNVSLVGLKFLSGQGGGYTSDAVEAIYYATVIGVKLTSNSWGGYDEPGLRDELWYAIEDAKAHGILCVAAAGNAAWDNDSDEICSYPSSYDCDNMIAVAATTPVDTLASFSCYGATTVDLGAPGVLILSSVPNNRYTFLDGTSMATPHVAGACALIAATAPVEWTAAEIKAHLLANTDPAPKLAGKCVTGGRLNIGKAAISPTPLARLAASRVGDTAPGGNGDEVCNPGETLGVTVWVQNKSVTTLTNVNLTLLSADPYVTVTDGAATVGEVLALATRQAQDTFTVVVAPNCPTPREVALDVQIAAGNGGPWSGTLRFTVNASSAISGSVTLDGAPVGEITVEYIGPLRGTRTSDANGAYSFGGIAGNYLVSALNTNWLSSLPTVVTVPPSANGVNFAFTTATVEGRVTDGLTGQPVAGVTIAYGDTLSGVTTTDDDGRYSFTRIYGRPATLKVTASYPAYFTATNSVTVPPSAAGVDFAMGRADIVADLTPLDVTATMGQIVTRTRSFSNQGWRDLQWRINPPGRERRAVTLNVLGPLAFDGATLWSAENIFDNGYLHKFDPLSGAWLGAVTVPDDCCEWNQNYCWNGLDWDGANLWVAHWIMAEPMGIAIHAINPATGAIVKTLRPTLPGVDLNYAARLRPGGMTLGDGCLWVLARCGTESSRVWKLDANTGAVLAHWPLPAEIAWPYNSYVGFWPAHEIEYVNGALYVSSTPYDAQQPPPPEGGSRLYKLNPDTGQVLDSFTIPGIEVYGLARAGTRDLWLLALHVSGYEGWTDAHLLELGDEPWMSESPQSGTLAYLGSQTVTLTMDTVPAGLGVHESVYRIASNDPVEPELTIPVKFTVLPNPANHAPIIAEGASASVTISEEGNPTPFALTLHATDADGDLLRWSVAAPAAHGAALALAAGGSVAVEYQPASDYFGADSFLVQVADNKGGTATIAVNVTIQNVNEAPTVTATASPTMGVAPLTVHFIATAADPDGDTLRYLWDFGTGDPSDRSDLSDPSFTYTNVGTYTIAVTATDPDGLSHRTTLLVSATAGAARGLVYAWGWNAFGQLGNGTTIDSWVPMQVPGILGERIMAGCGHNTLVLRDGTIVNWGHGTMGELGDGAFTDRLTPQPAPALAGGTALFADGVQTFVLKTGGAVWGCGLNNYGQLGDGSTTDRGTLTPMLQVGGAPFAGVRTVAASGNHTLLLKEDGTVWGGGANYAGQTGDGNTGSSTLRPVQVTKADGSPLTGITAIGLDQDSSFAMGGADGRVWAWGYNRFGELGIGYDGFDAEPRAKPVVCQDGSALTNIVAVDGGFHHVAALRSDGTVWNWGDNSKGQLGDSEHGLKRAFAVPAPISNVTAIAAGSYYTMALKTDGTVWVWGYDAQGGSGAGITIVRTPQQLSGLAQVTAISANMSHTVALVDESANAVIADTPAVIVPEGGTAAFDIKLAKAPLAEVTVQVSRASGDSDLTVQAGTNVVFTPANWDSWQTVTLAAAEDDFNVIEGSAAFTCSAAGLNSAGVMAREQENDATLTVLAAPGGAVSPDGSLIVPKGAATPIIATPEPGNVFVRWSVLSGAATIGDANAASTTVTLGNEAPATWPGTQIRADFGSPANRPPVITTPAWVGPNPTALAVGAVVHVPASDPDGDVLAYAWSQVSGPAAVAFSGPSAANGGVTFGVAGTYVLRVTVDDNRGGTATSDVTLSVTAMHGTDPELRITGFSRNAVPGEFVLRWQSASNRWYTVEAATNLLTGFNLNLRTNIAATYPVNVYTDNVSGANCKFYRVRIE